MAVRTKMPREERAKQFMPFAALKGYEEALRRTEAEAEENNAGMLYDINRVEDEKYSRDK